MRTISAERIQSEIERVIRQSLVNVEEQAVSLLKAASARESNQLAAFCLSVIEENNRLASETGCSACQDAGLAVIFVDIGQDVHIEGGLEAAINSGVRHGYADFRKSAAHPLTRINTGDNTPAVIHYNIVQGDSLEIYFLAKGAGAENMSRVHMLTPADGEEGIIAAVLDTVRQAAGNPCPPLVVGVGVGGTMERAAMLSKRALIRNTGEPSVNPLAARLERLLLQKINELSVGVQGFGGDCTALAVHFELFETHIGMLPVAVNLQCHSVRHGKIVL